jgi:hypothetical protein
MDRELELDELSYKKKILDILDILKTLLIKNSLTGVELYNQVAIVSESPDNEAYERLIAKLEDNSRPPHVIIGELLPETNFEYNFRHCREADKDKLIAYSLYAFRHGVLAFFELHKWFANPKASIEERKAFKENYLNYHDTLCKISHEAYLSDNEIEKSSQEHAQKAQDTRDYDLFIRETKMILSDDTTVNISYPSRKTIARSKDDLGFSEKSKATWPTLKLILENGGIHLGVIPKNKAKHKTGSDSKKYDKLYKHLQRISSKLIVFFNRENSLNIPVSYSFFESAPNNNDKGWFRPKFITMKEVEGIQIIQSLHKKAIPVNKFYEEIEKEK